MAGCVALVATVSRPATGAENGERPQITFSVLPTEMQWRAVRSTFGAMSEAVQDATESSKRVNTWNTAASSASSVPPAMGLAACCEGSLTGLALQPAEAATKSAVHASRKRILRS